MTKVPPYELLFDPLLKALNALGGSGSIEEIYDKVVELEHFPDDVVAVLHDPEKSNQTQLGYRLAWARTYLKKFGMLENSSRGIWSLSAKAKGHDKVNPQEVVKFVRGSVEGDPGEAGEQASAEITAPQDSPPELDWLVRRMLGEAGFTQVEVTGRSGDGGSTGKGSPESMV